MNLNNLKTRFQKPQNLFLALGLIFGIALCFITPPLQSPDEFAHFGRAYQFASGTLFSVHNKELGTGLDTVGGELPTSMIDFYETFKQFGAENPPAVKLSLLRESLNQPLDKIETEFEPITAFNYSPISYLGSITASFIGQQVNMSPLTMLYIGRLFNLFIALTFIYFAIKNTPRFKWVFLLLALMPMTLFQLASLSADSIGIGVTFLAIGIVFKYAFSNSVTKLTRKHILTLILLFAAIALWKQAYAPSALLFFLIPVSKIGSWKKYLFVGSVVVTLSVLPMLIWSLANAPIINAATQPANQFTSIIGNPIGFVKTLFLTYYSQSGMDYFLQAIGVLGWLNVPISFLFHALPYFLTIVFVAIYEGSKYVFGKKHRLVLFSVIAGVIGLISLSLYLIWTPAGNTIIEGIQGRYFLPIIPLAIALLSTRRIALKLSLSHPRLIVGFVLVTSCVLICARLVTYYYF